MDVNAKREYEKKVLRNQGIAVIISICIAIIMAMIFLAFHLW
jgi:hypothetical protein